MKSMSLILVIAFFFSAYGLSAAPKTYIDQAKVLKIAKDVDSKRFPNADSVLLDDYEKLVYQADGTSENWDEVYVKVLTEKGKRDNQTLTLYFTLPYSTVSMPILEIFKPDGNKVEIDVKKNSREAISRSQMSSNIYNPNNKVLKISVPGLEIGDVLHYMSHRNTVKTRVPDTWSDYFVLEYTSPIIHYVVDIDGPASLPLKSMQIKDEIPGAAKFKETKNNDRINYRWVVENVPRMYEEPNMPPLHTVTQRLLVSTIPSWRDISKWYWNLSLPRLEKVTPEMKEKVAELTKGIKEPNKKIEAIFQYVSQKIRYMGLTTEKVAPGYEPHDVNITFENKYGVCRDKAALLVAMLRIAGFDAYPVLIHNGPKKDVEVPQPYFNHAIACVKESNGRYILMDPTDENTREMFPAYLCDQSYLVAHPDGETLLTSPIVPVEENLMRISTTGVVDQNGALAFKTVLKFEGINDNAYRGYFARIKPEDRLQFFENKVQRLIAGARVVDAAITPENLMDTRESLTVVLDCVASDFLVMGKSDIIVPVPYFGTMFGLVNFVLGKTGLPNRKYPLKTDVTCGIQESVKITLPETIETPALTPSFKKISGDVLAWKRSIKTEKNNVAADSLFHLKTVEFTPKQYLELKKALKDIEFQSRKVPIYKRKDNANEIRPDTVIEKLESVVDVTDDSNWIIRKTVRKKVLTYAGKKDNAEIKIDYNPAWDQVALIDAKVTSPVKASSNANGTDAPVQGAKTTTKTLSKEELNIMDASWVGEAPRYPAGKTLVASLPNVDVGSIIEYTEEHKISKRQFFSAMGYFRLPDPIKYRKLTLKTPKTMKLSVQQPQNGVKYDEKMVGDKKIRVWEASDFEKVKSEKYLPPWWSFNPTVIVSAGDWKTYAKRLDTALTKAAGTADLAAQKARELVETVSGNRDKIIAVRDFIAKQIRTAGPDFTSLPLDALSSADTTLRDGYGNYADQAILLYAMLSEIGFSPEFVLASDYNDIPSITKPLLDNPQPFLFSAVLVKVELDGKSVYLNDTNQYAELGATSYDRCLALFLATGRKGVIQAAKNMKAKRTVSYAIKIDKSGKAEIRKKTMFYGDDFEEFHQLFAEMPPEERRRHFLESCSRLSQGALPVGDLVTKFDSYPGVEEFTVRIDSFAVSEGKFLYFDLPEEYRNIVKLSGDKRATPFYRDRALDLAIDYSVYLPSADMNIDIAPSNIDWASPGGSGSISVRCDQASEQSPRVLRIKENYDLFPAVIPASRYDDLKDIQKRLARPAMKTILCN